jgi:AraC-like DNA-binding protein
MRYVECYWSREERQGTPGERILPDGCVDILFSTLNREPVSLTVVGLMTTPLQCDLEAGRSFFGVRFRPGMAAAFMREAALLKDKVEPLETIWGGAARSISERLAESSSTQEMAHAMEAILRPVEAPDLAQLALWRLSASSVPLGQLTSDAGLSLRHFRRACVERAGVSPKHLRRILRFRKAVEKIRSAAANGAQPSWAQLAIACGYYDQAHFIKEFQEFAGSTPGRFLQSLHARSSLESKNNEPIKSRKSNRLH